MGVTVHVDEQGNIRKGPPLPIPIVLDGVYETSTRSSYLNVSGTESYINPPMTGRGALAGMTDEEFRNAASHSEPVGNAFHHGHVLNDENNELDDDQLSGLNQVPYAPFMRMLYAPHSSDGTLFTSQHRPPPGAPGAGGPPVLRAPGGGVTTAAAIEGQGGFRGGGLHGGGLSGKNGRTITDFDAGRSNAEEERRIAGLKSGGASLGSTTNRLRTAQQRGYAGGWNPLEMVNAQAARIVSNSESYHHPTRNKGLGVHKSHKPKTKCKKCQKSGKSCKKCSG